MKNLVINGRHYRRAIGARTMRPIEVLSPNGLSCELPLLLEMDQSLVHFRIRPTLFYVIAKSDGE